MIIPVISIDCVMSPSTSSFAVAPASSQFSPTLTVTLCSPFNVITGATSSTTLTVLTTETAAFPLLSFTLKVSVYTPGVPVTINPVISIDCVMSPSTSSFAVAPASLQFSPTLTVTLCSPFNVITGATSSTTLTVLTTEAAAFPLLSFTLKVSV